MVNADVRLTLLGSVPTLSYSISWPPFIMVIMISFSKAEHEAEKGKATFLLELYNLQAAELESIEA